MQFASLVSLSGSESYLRYVNITSTENLQLTLKFKTSVPDGLIFVFVGRMQTRAMPDSVSLVLSSGNLTGTRRSNNFNTTTISVYTTAY